MMHLLLVEDDPVMAEGICRTMAESGHTIVHVDSAGCARDAIAVEPFDAAIVDIGLPDESGTSLVCGLRRTGSRLPIVIVTARDSVTDRIDALDLGADDYLVKPFSLLELAARCRAVVRRLGAAASSQLTVGALSLDLVHRTATLGGSPMPLTPREWAILECLALRAHRVVSKDHLLTIISPWDRDMTMNNVESLISRLRAKLAGQSSISTLRGFGYRLDDER